MRIDKWLWAVRLFKTRSQAAHDCNAGKIKRAGQNLKPSSTLKTGDLLEVPSHDGTHKKSIEVVQLIEKRVAAPLARLAYLDHTPPEILALAEERKKNQQENRRSRQEGDQGRLTKRRRRQWESDDSKFF